MTLIAANRLDDELEKLTGDEPFHVAEVGCKERVRNTAVNTSGPSRTLNCAMDRPTEITADEMANISDTQLATQLSCERNRCV